jgi:hypothetical protein
MGSLYLSELSQDKRKELTDQLFEFPKGNVFLQDRDNSRIIHQIKYDIEDAYTKGKIIKQQYNLIRK